jgi:hypothetical protein
MDELREYLKRPVTLAAEAPEGSSLAIAMLKSAIGDCVDHEPHDYIRDKLWQAVEIIYRMKDRPQPVPAEGAQPTVAQLLDRLVHLAIETEGAYDREAAPPSTPASREPK